MKKILYGAAVAALLITSCQQTEVLNVVEDAIEFGTEIGKLTKSEETPNYNSSKYETLVAQGFRVWAVSDFSLGVDEKGKIYRGMENLPVIYSDGSWILDPETVHNKYFWPQAGKFLHFYALSSAKAKAEAWGDITADLVFYNTADVTPTTSVKFEEYNVEDAADDDIMVADHIKQDKNMGRSVSPNFRHTMTKVEFNFKKGGPADDGGAEEASEIVLLSVETTPLNYSGNLSVTFSKESDDMTFDWEVIEGDEKAFSKSVAVYMFKGSTNKIPVVSNFDEIENLVVDESFCVKDGKVYKYVNVTNEGELTPSWEVASFADYDVEGKALTTTFDNFTTWYMIPQTLETASLDEAEDENTERKLGGAVVTITYIADGKLITQNFDLNIKEGTDQDWLKETCVRYNVTIAPHKIVFQPSVDEWTEQSDNLKN